MNGLCCLILKPLMLLENKNNAENKQITIEDLSLLVWPIDGWEKRERGSLVLAKRQGDERSCGWVFVAAALPK